ncbi:MAG: methyltransferase domain-containing protein, partial [Planctomycetota bacterium]
MSKEDRRRWNEKHRAARDSSLGAVDPLLIEGVEHADLPAAARVLDFACGRGRHALELARRGFAVSAWDVSEEGLEELASRARELELTVAPRRVDLEALPADSGMGFDLICVVNFLDRRLPELLGPRLAPGGKLLLCTFTDDAPGEHPSARHRLRPGELQAGWPGYTSLHEV